MCGVDIIMIDNKIDRKYIKTYDVDDYEILTDTGWEDVESVSKTIPYDLWEIKTNKHSLKAADNHIVFTKDENEIFIKDLKIGDEIKTENGNESIISIKNLNKKENMYDIGVKSKNHRFYSNGILSHNSTAYTVFALWYALGNKDKAILICANKFKTAKDILQRIKMAYEELPLWLKPGIIEWNAASIKFDNGCKISAEATSGSSGRGGSINVLILDEFAFLKPSCVTGETVITLKNKLTNKIIDITISDAKKTIIDYSRYQILTKNGYKDFSNIIVRDTNSYYNMKFKNLKTNEIFELNLTGQHLVMIKDDWKKAAYIKVGTIIENNELISKIRICKKTKVYDAIDVNNERSFLAYNINLHNCEEEFLQSVFPVVSSSKTSKIIIVSTPNGMGNEFYRTWNRAQLNLNDGIDPNLKWQSVKIDWWEVPGRDEKWQKQQLETFNGSMDKFLQEYRKLSMWKYKDKIKKYYYK